MDKQVLAQVLGKLRFSASLPDGVLNCLAENAKLCGFPAGTTVFQEGSQNEQLMIISVGRVALDMNVPGRGNVRILSLGPGDMLAWSALLGKGRMTTSATALEDTQVVALAAREVLSACESDFLFGYHLMHNMAHSLGDRLVATRLQLLDLFAETTPEKPFKPQPSTT